MINGHVLLVFGTGGADWFFTINPGLFYSLPDDPWHAVLSTLL